MWTALFIPAAPAAVGLWVHARPAGQRRATVLRLLAITLLLTPVLLCACLLFRNWLAIPGTDHVSLPASSAVAALSALCLAPLLLSARTGRADGPPALIALTAVELFLTMPVSNIAGLPMAFFVPALLIWGDPLGNIGVLLGCAALATGLAVLIRAGGAPTEGRFWLALMAVYYGGIVAVGLTEM